MYLKIRKEIFGIEDRGSRNHDHDSRNKDSFLGKTMYFLGTTIEYVC